jgi:hypothetical protein
MHLRGRRRDTGLMVFGVILLLVGGYYFLRNTLGFAIGDIDWDAVWPVLVIVIGSVIFLGALNRTNQGEPKV